MHKDYWRANLKILMILLSIWFLGISPEGIGFIGMMINIVIALAVSSFYSKPPEHVYEMVDNIRRP